MALSALRTTAMRAASLRAAAPAVAACAVAPLRAAVSAPAWRASSLRSAVAMPAAPSCRRLLHSSCVRLGGGGGDGPFEFHGGSDFVPREAVERRVLQVLREVEKIDKTKLEDPNSTFRDLGLDSLDEVEVVMMLEGEFEIDIQDEVASTICSPLDAINYISQHPFAAHDWRDHHDDHH